MAEAQQRVASRAMLRRCYCFGSSDEAPSAAFVVVVSVRAAAMKESDRKQSSSECDEQATILTRLKCCVSSTCAAL